MTNPYISVAKRAGYEGILDRSSFLVWTAVTVLLGKGNMSDVIIICNINQETGEIKLVSLFRDTYLNVDD